LREGGGGLEGEGKAKRRKVREVRVEARA